MLSNFINRADVRMVQRRGETRFATKPFKGIDRLRRSLRQEFKRHQASKIDVLGLVHPTHPADTKLFQNLVMSYSRANHAII